MIKRITICMLLVSMSIGAIAQNASDSITAEINKFFSGMKNADTFLLKATLAANATLQSITGNAGNTSVVQENISQFITFINKQKVGDADERITIETIKTDGALAMVWIPYQFYYKGRFSHCGVNLFTLVRIGTQWKIQSIIDTRRKEGCL